MKYPSDLTSKQWRQIKQVFDNSKRGDTGKHLQLHRKRRLVNAALYLNKTGCQWRQMPHDYPKWQTVYSFYQRAAASGLWEKICGMLVKKSRIAAGRSANPSYALIDSRSVKTASAAENRGYDGGKKVKGRKHHIVTDILGNLLFVQAHAANIHDSAAGGKVIEGALLKYPSLAGVCGDAGYRKTFEEDAEKLGLTVDIIQRIADAGWAILPKRWRVERTLSWLKGSRRLSKDYEITSLSVENMIMISHMTTLLRRLF
jgi:putative transposase